MMNRRVEMGLLVGLLVVMSVGLLNCEVPKHQFVVLRDVPPSPTFVVLPPNQYLYEVSFANEIESLIIGLGVKVKLRPTTKKVTEKTGAGVAGIKAEESQLVGRTGDRELVESYYAYEAIDADYVVKTYRSANKSV